MSEKSIEWTKIIGWLLFTLAIMFFCFQMAYLYANKTFQVEYVDDRIFYIINIVCVICLSLAVIFLLKLTNKWKNVWIAIASLFVMINGVLLIVNNQEIKNVINISPNYKHVISLKTNTDTGQTTYYRNYYGILARPKEKLPYEVAGDFKVDWLTDDIGAVTYQGTDNHVHQFIATYGTRSDSNSYYNVGPEIYGTWQGENVKVISNTQGITVTHNGNSELFEFNHVVQFGTIAVVLTRENEAAWTIALNKNIKINTAENRQPTGDISLYKATMEETEPIILQSQALE